MKDSIFKTLVKRATYSSTGTLAARLTAAAAGMLLARSVGAEQFGMYAALWALVNLSVAFTEIGIKDGLIRDGARYPQSLPTLLGNTMAVKVIIGLGVLTISYFSSSVITSNPGAKSLYTPLAIAGLATLCTDVLYAALYVIGKQKAVASFEICRGVCFFLGILLLAFFKFTVIVFAWFQGLLYLFALILISFVALPAISIDFDLKKVKKQISSSFVFGISGVVYTIYIQLPLLLLSYFHSEVEVGYFAVAERFVMIVLLIGAGANNNVFLPMLFGLFKKSGEQFRNVCEFMQKLYVPIGIFAASALYVCADLVIIFIMGEEYRASVHILRIICWTVALRYVALPADAALTAANMMWKKIIIQICAAAIGLAVGFITIGQYGTTGASITTLVISFILAIMFIPYVYKKKLLGLLKYKSVLMPIGFIFIFGILLTKLLPTAYFQRSPLFLIVSVIVLAPFFIKLSRDYSLITVMNK